jgi:Flp pilus assembly protein TadD
MMNGGADRLFQAHTGYRPGCAPSHLSALSVQFTARRSSLPAFGLHPSAINSRLSHPLDRPEHVSAPDPEQLPLGMFEGVPLVPVETYGPDDEVVIIPVREPPVCGEWSYDDAELEEPRFVARRVDGIAAPTMKATPIAPMRAVMDAKPLSAPASRALRPTIEALRLAFEQSPGDTARALAYVAALEKKNDATLALTVLDKAEAAGGELFGLTCARASVLGAKLRYDDADVMLKKAAKLRPDASEVHLQTGILACRRARWRDAIEPLRRAVALDASNASAHYYIGEALNQTDDRTGALTAFLQAAELEPDHWRALKGVGIVLDRLGRSPEAAEYYRRARDAQRA